MGNDPFSFTAFNFNEIQGGYVSIQEEVVFQGKPSFSQTEFLGEIDPLPTEQGKGAHLFKDQIQQQQQESKFENLILEEFSFDSLPQLTQPFQETAGLKNQGVASSEIVEYNKQMPPSSSLASLELLSNYGSKVKRLRGHNISNTEINTQISSAGPKKLSAEDIVRVAGARYVQFSAHWYHNICMPMHPYGFDLGGLSEEETRDVELAQFLLAAAERVDCQQFERASRLLLHCQWNSSARAHPVQRVIFHFSQALRERIVKETGRMTQKGYERNEENELIQKLDPNISITCHQKIPFNQVMQFAGIQAMVENLATQTKIHIIDLEIRQGMQWTALMQALAERQERPIERLKVTAIGFTGISKLEETGKRLVSFAESLSLPFSYKAVFVADIIEIKESQFEIEDDEAVAVYSPYVLRTMISRPDCLENLMGVLRYIKPSIMVVLEVEANLNSPSFVNRFIEALFFYSASFDCIETCLNQEKECRMAIEAILSEGIRNIVAMEGRERTVRYVKIDVWRRFFARYRMMEIGFSESSIYQANLVVKEFASGNSCSIDKNGKCLIVGWKGSPTHAISAWRFL